MDARRNVSAKTIGIDGPYRHEGRGDGEVPDRAHRQAGISAAALRGVPAAMPEGTQHAADARVARSVDAEAAAETALPAATGKVPSLWRAGGGFSLGQAVGTGDYSPCQCRSGVGTGVELAGDGTAVRVGLEKRRQHRTPRGGLRIAASPAAAGAGDWNRRSESAEGTGVSDGGLRSGAAGVALGGRRSDRGGGEAVLHPGT